MLSASNIPQNIHDEPFVTRLIDLFCDPARSLFQIAEELGLTFQALTLLITRPSILARLNTIDSAAAYHTRFVAGLHLHAVIPSLASTLKANVEEEKSIKVDITNPASIDATRRRRESARRAGALLLRLARFSPGATPVRVSRAHEPSVTTLAGTTLAGTALQSGDPHPVQNATTLQPSTAPRPTSPPTQTPHHTTPTPNKPAAAPQPSLQPPTQLPRPLHSSSNSRIQQLQSALIRSNLPQPVS